MALRSQKGDGWVSSWAHPHVEGDYEEPPRRQLFEEFVSGAQERMPDPTEMLRCKSASSAFFVRALVAGGLSLIPGLGWLLWVAIAFGITSLVYVVKFATAKL